VKKLIPDKVYYNLGKTLARKAVALAPKEAGHSYTPGVAHYRNGARKEALGALRRATELSRSTLPDAMRHHGRPRSAATPRSARPADQRLHFADRFCTEKTRVPRRFISAWVRSTHLAAAAATDFPSGGAPVIRMAGERLTR